jgi:hypothetical protein
MTENQDSNAADLEQLEQENAIWPWLADGSMADYEEDEVCTS